MIRMTRITDRATIKETMGKLFIAGSVSLNENAMEEEQCRGPKGYDCLLDERTRITHSEPMI